MHKPNFQRLMDLVHSGMVQEVIITRLDRLARSLPTLRRILDEFQASGVTLKVLDDSIDLQSAAGKFHINLLGAVAEMESDRISERSWLTSPVLQGAVVYFPKSKSPEVYPDSHPALIS